MIAGPFFGEFGHELMVWQAHLRYMARHKEVNVRCLLGHKFLYQDFATNVYERYQRPEGIKPNMYKPVYIDEKAYLPSHKKWKNKKLEKKFRKYGKKGSHLGFDVLIHARTAEREGDTITGDRIWPRENWEQLIDKLGDVEIGWVGTKKEAAYYGKGNDMRGVRLDLLADVMANSKLIIGPSSGVMHFASLCGLTHLVWTDQRKWSVQGRKTTNYNRYTKYWNPFGTQAVVVDDKGWQPSVERILRAIDKNKLL